MAAYCRVSTEKEEQLSSLENQREFFEQYADKEGDTLVKIYADEGISGKSMNKREAFTQLLEDSKTGAFDYVAVKDISRFARNTSDFLYGIRTLRSNGVDVRFLSNNQTVIGKSEFVLTVFAALAHTYTLEINEQESYIVQLMFKWYIEGEGTRRIAIKLNEMAIPTKKQAKWVPKTIRRILQNPIYIGKIINNKSVTKDFLSGTREAIPQEEWYIHERPELRIISDDDFELVQHKIKERQEQYKNDNPGNRFSNRHLFSNLIKCGECGKSFTAKVYQWKNRYVRYRCCVHNNNGNAHCTNSVTVDEQELLNEVKSYLLTAIEDKKAFADKLMKQYQAQTTNVDVSKLTDTRQSLEKRRSKFKEMFAADIITMDELKKEMSAIDEGMRSIDEELKVYDEIQKKATHIDDIHKDIEQILMQNEYTNDDMRRIIEKIVVYPDKSVEIFMK